MSIPITTRQHSVPLVFDDNFSVECTVHDVQQEVTSCRQRESERVEIIQL